MRKAYWRTRCAKGSFKSVLPPLLPPLERLRRVGGKQRMSDRNINRDGVAAVIAALDSVSGPFSQAQSGGDSRKFQTCSWFGAGLRWESKLDAVALVNHQPAWQNEVHGTERFASWVKAVLVVGKQSQSRLRKTDACRVSS